jgi:hypothetical protein
MLIQINPTTHFATRMKCEQLRAFGLDERKFQHILFEQLERLMPDDELLLIMESRRWQEEPDLLAVDAQGNLYIFELKVWESTAENLLQVLRYGQIFGTSTYEDLNHLYEVFHKTGKSLKEAHAAKFEVSLSEKEFNRAQTFIVITNGLDVKTREAIRYWRGTKLDIRPWPYRVYKSSIDQILIEMNPFRVSDDPSEDVMQGYYILNTNIRNSESDDKYMIDNKKAAAFFDPWKRKIEILSKGDIVFLYRSGTGIVAMGTASGPVEKRAYHEDINHPDEEYAMSLSSFRMISPAITASQIKDITGVNYRFMQTMFGLDNESGQKLLQKAKENV